MIMLTLQKSSHFCIISEENAIFFNMLVEFRVYKYDANKRNHGTPYYELLGNNRKRLRHVLLYIHCSFFSAVDVFDRRLATAKR